MENCAYGTRRVSANAAADCCDGPMGGDMLQVGNDARV